MFYLHQLVIDQRSKMSLKFLFTILVIVKTSSSLVCKNCNVDCTQPFDETCLEPGDDQQTSCLTETFIDKENKTQYQRKCVLYAKETRFECVDYPSYTTISCVTCNTDLCNVAPPSSNATVVGKNGTVDISEHTTRRSNRTPVGTSEHTTRRDGSF